MITIEEEELQKKIDAVKQQKEQALATFNLAEGALQAYKDLLKNHQSMTLKDLGDAVGGVAEEPVPLEEV